MTKQISLPGWGRKLAGEHASSCLIRSGWKYVEDHLVDKAKTPPGSRTSLELARSGALEPQVTELPAVRCR